MKKITLLTLMTVLLLSSCEKEGSKKDDLEYLNDIPLEEIAHIFSSINMDDDHLNEVYDAVSESIKNGYDEEYMMKDLFSSPGAGVGMKDKTKASNRYSNPLKNLIQDHLKSTAGTKTSLISTKSSSAGAEVMTPTMVEDYLNHLEASNIQIYWPYSDNWDSESYPTITFAPNSDSDENIGYKLDEINGEKVVQTVTVDENYAKTHPVWVINKNEDSHHPTLEMLREEDPNFSEGGEIIIKSPSTKSPDVSEGLKTLVLRDFIMKRNFDNWFRGASEFFIKTGSVENFYASTEAELKLYSPSITDFMVVVKRGQKNVPVPFNAVLVSDWSPQLEQSAFMIIEDDGGTKTTWKAEAIVKVESKSYGITLTIPINTSDDIVWRGQLSSRYIFANNKIPGQFGDVDLVFEVIDYD